MPKFWTEPSSDLYFVCIGNESSEQTALMPDVISTIISCACPFDVYNMIICTIIVHQCHTDLTLLEQADLDSQVNMVTSKTTCW